MGYNGKQYGDKSSAEATVENIKEGRITNDGTAYRNLLRVTKEWQGTDVAREAEDLIDERYSEYK